MKVVYGKCPCGGVYETRLVDIRMTVGEQLVVLTDISQGACPHCGSRVYKAVTLERIESLMKKELFGDSPQQHSIQR
jgi:YgiT-type zinc finger domain-containing protein